MDEKTTRLPTWQHFLLGDFSENLALAQPGTLGYET